MSGRYYINYCLGAHPFLVIAPKFFAWLKKTNSTFGKTMENMEKRIGIKLLAHFERVGKRRGAKPSFKTATIFSENLPTFFCSPKQSRYYYVGCFYLVLRAFAPGWTVAPPVCHKWTSLEAGGSVREVVRFPDWRRPNFRDGERKVLRKNKQWRKTGRILLSWISGGRTSSNSFVAPQSECPHSPKHNTNVNTLETTEILLSRTITTVD